MIKQHEHNMFQQYFNDCLAMAKTEKQRTIMWKCMGIYNEYYDDGVSAYEAMVREWGVIW